MGTSFAELLLLAAIGAGLYFIFRPIQRWLERAILRALGGPKHRSGRPIIDISAYNKKDKS